MDNHGLWQQLAELVAAFAVLFDDFDLNLRVFQKLCHVIRDLAASYKHGGFDGIIDDSGLLEEFRGFCRRRDDGDLVSRLHLEITAGDDDLLSPLHRTDQDGTVKLVQNVTDLHGMELRVVGNEEF